MGCKLWSSWVDNRCEVWGRIWWMKLVRKRKGGVPFLLRWSGPPMLPTMLRQNVAEEKMKGVINITIITKKVKTTCQHKRKVKTENRSMGRRRRLWHSMFCIGGKVKQLKTKKLCNERRASLVVPAKKVPLSLLAKLSAKSNTRPRTRKKENVRPTSKMTENLPGILLCYSLTTYLAFSFFLSLSLSLFVCSNQSLTTMKSNNNNNNKWWRHAQKKDWFGDYEMAQHVGEGKKTIVFAGMKRKSP